jgi:hypothetical protein
MSWQKCDNQGMDYCGVSFKKTKRIPIYDRNECSSYGYRMIYDSKTDKYYDKETGQEVQTTDDLPCKKCGLKAIPVQTDVGFGIDACFGGMIDGVHAACCGHGNDDHAYVCLIPGWRL